MKKKKNDTPHSDNIPPSWVKLEYYAVVMIYNPKTPRYRAYLTPPAPETYQKIREPECPICLETWTPWSRKLDRHLQRDDFCWLFGGTIPDFECAQCHVIVCGRCREGALVKCCNDPECMTIVSKCPMCRATHALHPSMIDEYKSLGWIDNAHRRWRELHPPVETESSCIVQSEAESEAESETVFRGEAMSLVEDPIQMAALVALEGIHRGT